MLAFYSEHRETLLEFAATYFSIGSELGAVVALDYLVPPPGSRSRSAKLVRQTPKKLETSFESLPEKLIGIVMHLRGDLFFSRFQPDSGLHVIKEKKSEKVCLVESAPLPFPAYEPPPDMDRPGTIAARGAVVCRSFHRDKRTVHDNVLGDRVWSDFQLRRCVLQLSEERLNAAIEAATS